MDGSGERQGGSAGRIGPGGPYFYAGLAVQPRQPGRPTSLGWRPRHPSTGGDAMFRVNRRVDGIDDAGTIEGAREIVQGQPPAQLSCV
jgi:hypothetical protein